MTSPCRDRERHPEPPGVLPLAAVADSSADDDRQVKLPLYARNPSARGAASGRLPAARFDPES